MVDHSLLEKIQYAVETDKIEGRRMYTIFNALGDTNRFLLFKFLINHKDICVSDIAHIFNVSISATSQQLKVLETSGLVRRNRIAQKICYEVKQSDSIVQSVIRIISI